MSIAIVLPSLTDWTEERISAIYSATTESDFESAFDAFLAQEVTITSNGQRLTREQYKQKLLTEKKGEISGGVSFTGAVQANGAEGQLLVAGTVGLFFQATLVFSTSTIGQTTSNLVNSSLNVTIIEDPAVRPPGVGVIRGDSDPRRVSVLNEVVTENPNPLIPLTTPSSSS